MAEKEFSAGAAIRNVGGSFYDFEAVQFEDRKETLLLPPPDDWGGRAAVDWLGRVARGERFDAGMEQIVTVAALIDEVYGR